MQFLKPTDQNICDGSDVEQRVNERSTGVRVWFPRVEQRDRLEKKNISSSMWLTDWLIMSHLCTKQHTGIDKEQHVVHIQKRTDDDEEVTFPLSVCAFVQY